MKYFELEHDNCKGIYKKGKPYSISIGAGVCFGIMPNWQELTHEVLVKTVDDTLSRADFDNILTNLGWSLDSLLQAALNRQIENNGSIDEFNEIMQNALYDSILTNAETYNLKEELKKFISDPFRRNNEAIIPLYDFFKNEYGNTSLFKISEFLLEAKRKGFPPKAILTFNADVLLHSLLTLMELKETHDSVGNTNTADFSYKAVHHVIESDGHKIPIYHIHGSIVPFSGKRDARENLVFPENSYHNVAGSTHSWQQSIFQYYAERTKMVFIGLSMSDPNIRRWLSHTNSVLNRDIFNMTGEVKNTTNHLWVTPKSTSNAERELKKLGLYHLGIKVAEIDNWSRLKDGMLNLIS
jgi:hypothetical protein